MVAAEKSLVAGNISIQTQSRAVVADIYRQVLVPADMNLRSSAVATCAECVVVVEKDATFSRLMQDRLLVLIPSAMLVTGKGYPDVAVRVLLRRLADTYPALRMIYVGDADPHGIEIFLTYFAGPMSGTHVLGGGDLRLFDRIRWVGIHMEDVPAACQDSLTLRDRRKCAELLGRIQTLLSRLEDEDENENEDAQDGEVGRLPHDINAFATRQQLLALQQIVERMDRGNCKAETQGLLAIGPLHLSHVYVADKVAEASNFTW